jgi:CheY-like chemotaxis protein
MLKDKRILAVDDSVAVRNYLRTILTRQGVSVDVAGTGQEGPEMCAGDEEYDLILLDLILPDLNGIDVLRRIRQEDDETTVVILTGVGGVKSAIAAVQHDADAYVEKEDIAGVAISLNSSISSNRHLSVVLASSPRNSSRRSRPISIRWSRTTCAILPVAF